MEKPWVFVFLTTIYESALTFGLLTSGWIGALHHPWRGQSKNF